MKKKVFPQFIEAKHSKKLAILIDPDRLRLEHLQKSIQMLQEAQVDFVMIGGSLILDNQLDYCLDLLRREVPQPTIIFPGSPLQISGKADAILLLSLISGRNPEYLIGQHVVAAPYLKASGLEIISTGYMLIDGGQATTANYMSQAMPIPSNKPEIAVCTAMAGEMLGLSTIYLDAGSGALNAIPTRITQAVAQEIKAPIIVGGGIRQPDLAIKHIEAGADIIMVGTGAEKDPYLIKEMADAIHNFNSGN